MLSSFRIWAIMLYIALPLVCWQAAAQQPVSTRPSQQVLDLTQLEAYVRHLFIWSPEVKVSFSEPKPSGVTGLREVTVSATSEGSTQQQRLLLSDDGQGIVFGTVFQLNKNPFQADLAKLKLGEDPALGTQGAPVAIVLFTDFQCPYCREESQQLRRYLLDAYPKEVRLYVKDLPLEPIHPWARQAAIAGRCIYRQNSEAYWQYHDWIFEKQAEITPANLTDKVMEFAQGKQIDTLQLNSCLSSGATAPDVDRSVAEARSLQVDSVPTLFVNGRRINRQLPWAQLRTVIDNELRYQESAKNAGDQPCCVVTPPSPLGN